MHHKRLPESVRAIVKHIDVADFDFEGAVLCLSLEHIPALVNELARIARERATVFPGKTAPRAALLAID